LWLRESLSADTPIQKIGERDTMQKYPVWPNKNKIQRRFSKYLYS